MGVAPMRGRGILPLQNAQDVRRLHGRDARGTHGQDARATLGVFTQIDGRWQAARPSAMLHLRAAASPAGRIRHKEKRMGCCLIVAIGLALPRLLMLFIWLLTNWFGQAFHTWFFPALGFCFLPYTTLAYMAAMLNNNHTVSVGWLALIVLAALVDLGHWGIGPRAWRRRTVIIRVKD